MNLGISDSRVNLSGCSDNCHLTSVEEGPTRWWRPSSSRLNSITEESNSVVELLPSSAFAPIKIFYVFSCFLTEKTKIKRLKSFVLLFLYFPPSQARIISHKERLNELMHRLLIFAKFINFSTVPNNFRT